MIKQPVGWIRPPGQIPPMVLLQSQRPLSSEQPLIEKQFRNIKTKKIKITMPPIIKTTFDGECGQTIQKYKKKKIKVMTPPGPIIIRTTFDGNCGQVRIFNRHYIVKDHQQHLQQKGNFDSIKRKIQEKLCGHIKLIR